MLDGLGEAAMNSAMSLQANTATGLLYAIETHKTLDLDLRLGAPTLIIPTKGAMLAVDLGVLSIASDLGGKAQVCGIREGL